MCKVLFDKLGNLLGSTGALKPHALNLKWQDTCQLRRTVIVAHETAFDPARHARVRCFDVSERGPTVKGFEVPRDVSVRESRTYG